MKYNVLFKLSFIMYIFIIFAGPYVTAKSWADMIALLFVITVGYQMLYLFYLRKKEHFKFGRTIAQYFLYALMSLELWTVLHSVDLAINGFSKTDWFGSSSGETVYGWEAITGDGISLYIYSVIMIGATIYQIIYAMILTRMKNGRQQGE